MGIRPEKTPRILFVSEAVTLAHFARPVTLARALDPRAYDVYLASDARYLSLIHDPKPFSFRPIDSIPSQQFIRALEKGKPVYDAKTLRAYVEQDIKLLEELEPDLVIGDFRLSLAISAPIVGVPVASIVNAYWSPYARMRYLVPDLPQLRLLGRFLAQTLFDAVRPLAFALHAIPLNRVRRGYGLPSLGHDLRKVYTWGDYTLYADMSEAVPTAPLPANHRFIGPVFWSPEVETPGWWQSLPNDRPVVYVSAGSSGREEILPIVFEALGDAPVTLIASAAGRPQAHYQGANVFVADYLPGELATKRARLIICNGGNMTTYQALAFGVPVIGIAKNMDQLLNMQAVERLQAGIAIRAEDANPTAIRKAATAILGNPSYTLAAQRVATVLSTYDPKKRFLEFITDLFH